VSALIKVDLAMPIQVLLDTDIGTDIDDAACLAYLLAHPGCDLLGITTVTGQPERRAQIASALCHAAGRPDIPIYPGTADPLLVPQYQITAPQADALAGWPHETQFPQGEAIAFLRNTIRQHPGEVTLLTIGPLTNVGLLFALDPEIPRLLKAHILMSGVYGPPPPGYAETEWNLSGDPHASAAVLLRPARVHRAVGLDVTALLWMDAATLAAKFASHPLLVAVWEIGRSSIERWGGMVFHDPLAAATLLTPDLCSFARGTVEVETCGPVAGKAHFTPSPAGPHEIAISVDAERFFAHYFAVFS
jgi:purine nucleosidase